MLLAKTCAWQAMLSVLMVALCSAAYLLVAVCCLCKRESELTAAHMRSQRILATLDMEECGHDTTRSPTPLADEPWVAEQER